MSSLSLGRFLGGFGLTLMLTAAAYGGGSSYSRFGVGDLVHTGGSRIDAMGGAGIALTGEGFINLLNPAGIGRIGNVTISGSFLYSMYSSRDRLGKADYGRGSFHGAAVAIPVDKEHGISIFGEAAPMSNVQYAIRHADEMLVQSFYGTGGLSRLAFGGSYAPTRKLSVGVTFNYVFGRTRQLGAFDFVDANFTDSQIDRSDFYSGFNFTLGTIYEGAAELLGASVLAPLTVGLTLTTPAIVSVRQERILTSRTIYDTTFSASGTMELPLALGLGFSYLFSGRYTLTGDVLHRFWTPSNFFGPQPVGIRNSTRVAFGFEATPLRTATGYWERVAYRVGMCYNFSYLTIDGTGIDEWSVTGGLGLPIGPDARCNLGVQAGARGLAPGLYPRDFIVRFTVALSASEVWFLRIEED